ncbi:MAG: threonylcarbamoyl-AMP synthase [Clostridia bacterium]|nr:threonylcarbamoyl-AMP synthase [Clostridia bacterium]
MKTLRLSDDANGIKIAAEIIKSGGVVAIPTETVYGLAANAYDEKAVNKIFIAKGRPQDNPLIVHTCNLGMTREIVEDFSEDAEKLAQNFWPGPLTIILKRSEKIPSSVSAGLDTVAVRMPSNEVARKLIEVSGLPLAAPSANTSGSPSPTSADHVLKDLDGKIDAIIISDDCTVGVESTVVTLAVSPYRILRPGFVTFEEIAEILPETVVDKAVLQELKNDEKAASPGMKYKHYSPKAEVYLVEGEKEAFRDFVNQKENSVAICFEEDLDNLKIKAISYGGANDTKKQARTIFGVLRKVDEMGIKTVYVHAPKKEGIGLAVYNRLIRAAAFKVISL